MATHALVDVRATAPPKRRRGWHNRRGFTPAQRAEIIERWQAHEPTRDIARRFAADPRTIRRVVQGLTRPRRLGRYVSTKGYVYVQVPDEHPLSVMRDAHGYCLEHRLVMAEAVGRPLFAHETVHHKNGAPTDNVLGNLQLRSGRHGKGVALRCRCCGSNDIEATEV